MIERKNKNKTITVVQQKQNKEVLLWADKKWFYQTWFFYYKSGLKWIKINSLTLPFKIFSYIWDDYVYTHTNRTDGIINFVSKETVVLHQWESEKWKFGFIRWVDKGRNYHMTMKDLKSWGFEHWPIIRALTKGLMLELMAAFQIFHVVIQPLERVFAFWGYVWCKDYSYCLKLSPWGVHFNSTHSDDNFWPLSLYISDGGIN